MLNFNKKNDAYTIYMYVFQILNDVTISTIYETFFFKLLSLGIKINSLYRVI